MSSERRAAPALRVSDFGTGLQGTRFAGRLELLESVDSTIEHCRRLADAGAPEGLVVLAEEQRQGRGQRGRSWHSPRGLSLSLSALLRPEIQPARLPELVKLAGLAAARSLSSACGLRVELKRPNDLLVDGPDGDPRKLGGLLVDGAVQGEQLRHAIVSMGLNVNQRIEDFPQPLQPWAASLRLVTGAEWSRAELAACFLRELERAAKALGTPEADAWLEAWEDESRERPDFAPPAWTSDEAT